MTRYIFFYFITIFSVNSLASDLQINGKLEQGGLAYGWVPKDTSLSLGVTEIDISPEGYFIFGISRNSPSTLELKVTKNKIVSKKIINIKKRDWIIERINGLPRNTVSPDNKTLKRIRNEGALISQRRKISASSIYFKNGFILPSVGRVSGVFGSQRVLNGKPRSPHSGLDLAAPIGTKVIATADGIVSLVHDYMILTGKTVMIDHGFGLQSIYIHLNDIFVKEGELVEQGQLIAEIGVTGRTSGPHLHFGITWYGVKLDPQSVLEVLPIKDVIN